MTCGCIKMLDEHLAKHNSRIVVALTFGGDGELRVAIPTEKINPRSRDRMSAVATFCPFCGTKYDPAAEISA